MGLLLEKSEQAGRPDLDGRPVDMLFVACYLASTARFQRTAADAALG
jgi:hypothetical protein